MKPNTSSLADGIGISILPRALDIVWSCEIIVRFLLTGVYLTAPAISTSGVFAKDQKSSSETRDPASKAEIATIG